MSVTLRNTANQIRVVGSLSFAPYESKEVAYVTDDVEKAVSLGYLEVVAGNITIVNDEISALTDSTTGTATTTVADATALFVKATLNNNFASLASRINALSAKVNNIASAVGARAPVYDNATVLGVDFSPLDTAMSTVVTANLVSTDYTYASWATLQGAMNVGYAIRKNYGATQTQIQNTATAINTAYANLSIVRLACLYPLDDDGTVATGFGFEFAGPAVGEDSQSMDYTASVAGEAILAPANIFSTARVSRPESGSFVVEAEVTSVTGASGGVLLLVITNAAGDLVNVASNVATTTDLLAFIVNSAGTVTAYLNESTEGVTLAWQNAEGVKVVGATDKVGFALLANDNTEIGDTLAMVLRTSAADITGSYGAGIRTICGELV